MGFAPSRRKDFSHDGRIYFLNRDAQIPSLTQNFFIVPSARFHFSESKRLFRAALSLVWKEGKIFCSHSNFHFMLLPPRLKASFQSEKKSESSFHVLHVCHFLNKTDFFGGKKSTKKLAKLRQCMLIFLKTYLYLLLWLIY